MEPDFGEVIIHLDKLIKDKKISKTKLSYLSHLTRTQINKFCKNEACRYDSTTLAKLCYALECDLSELLEYIPPEQKENKT